MESKLDDHVSMVFSQPNITAVQCISLDGLCLTSRGSTNDLTCGLLSSVYKHAQWKDDETESPVVVIEQDSGRSLAVAK
ncbi:unnamed protein product [Dicrocoelium dendriticum]|nr:unnamed protein product [Dicrocoelium dendriticum]